MSSKHQIPGSSCRSYIESAFFANSVRKTTMAELYDLAAKQPEVIVTSQPMYKPEQFGLPHSAKVLVSNDGGIVGRTAKSRRLVREMGKEKDRYMAILAEAIYHFNKRPGLWLEGILGIHHDFMIKANLLSRETDAKGMLDWGFNFAAYVEPWVSMYEKSRPINEPDVLVFVDHEWSNSDFPDGLVIIDEAQNCIAILGMRYFGEKKKGTLTLAWTIGVRHNMVACHGGIKKVGNHPPVAVFGLSGSGKSSLTNSADHGGTLRKDEKVKVIHDDAFLIDLESDFTVAIEPALFDKTDSVKFDDQTLKYYYSAQNVGVTMLPDGKKHMVFEDIRNVNGRCIKSRDMFQHESSCERPGMVIWLQKDTSLPPVSKVSSIELSVAMGASLSTRRAKGVENVDAKELEKLVVEPFANPFRVHPLNVDCQQFKKLFKLGTQCYIMNTYAFGIPGSIVDIPKEISLKIVTELLRGGIEWTEWKEFEGLMIPKNGNALFGSDYNKKYEPLKTQEYVNYLSDRIQDRINYLSKKRDVEHDMDTEFIDPLIKAKVAVDKILHSV